jgi:hypothetical protein
LVSGVLAVAVLGVGMVAGAAGASDDHDPDAAHDAEDQASGGSAPGPADGQAAEGPADGSAGRTGDRSDGGAEPVAGRLKARLSGLNEVGPDGKTGAGVLAGTGRATVSVRAGSRLCWTIRAEGIGPAILAHIHLGARGDHGGVVVDFDASFKGCKTIDAGLAADIVANPESYYVNVHTEDFKAGAIRGQLRVEPDEVEFQARLLGTNEVGGGDPDGRGKLDVDLRGTLLCWKFRAQGLEPVAAQHIHQGAAGTNGPIVVDFDGNARGCRDITASLAAEITADPAGYYGNMHTAGFPAGAIRGQLVAGD